MCEHRFLEICDIPLECILLCGVFIVLMMSTSMVVGAVAALLLHLNIVTHGDVSILNYFLVIIMKQLPSCNI